jgi:hypothetical protein
MLDTVAKLTQRAQKTQHGFGDIWSAADELAA